MSGRQRDSQRSKLYAAEQVLRGGSGLSPREVEQFFQKVLTSPYTVRKYGTHARVYLKMSGRSRSMAWAHWDGQVDLSAPFARRKDVVLHELAHHFAGISHGHDWRFCEVYLDLVRHFMGKASHNALKASMRAKRVKFTQPRQHTGLRTPAQQAAAAAGAERLAEARAKRQGVSGRFGILLEDQYGRKLLKGMDKWGRITRTTSYPSRAAEWKTQAGVTGAFVKLNNRISNGFNRLMVDLDVLDEMTYSLNGLDDLSRAVVRF